MINKKDINDDATKSFELDLVEEFIEDIDSLYEDIGDEFQKNNEFDIKLKTRNILIAIFTLLLATTIIGFYQTLEYGVEGQKFYYVNRTRKEKKMFYVITDDSILFAEDFYLTIRSEVENSDAIIKKTKLNKLTTSVEKHYKILTEFKKNPKSSNDKFSTLEYKEMIINFYDSRIIEILNYENNNIISTLGDRNNNKLYDETDTILSNYRIELNFIREYGKKTL